MVRTESFWFSVTIATTEVFLNSPSFKTGRGGRENVELITVLRVVELRTPLLTKIPNSYEVSGDNLLYVKFVFTTLDNEMLS